MKGQGGSLGPDLTQVAGKLNAAAIVEALVNPSASITFGFEGTTLTLNDGETIQGFLRGAGDPLLIQNIATGTQEAVPQEMISKRETMGQSLMPAAASLGLQSQDVADLAAFLSSLQGAQ